MADTSPGAVAGAGGCEQLIDLLLVERRGTDPAAWRSGTPDAPDAQTEAWHETAAALAAGEPKRALAVLDASPAPSPGPAAHRGTHDQTGLAVALRTAALAMDTHWQPGLTPVRLQTSSTGSTGSSGTPKGAPTSDGAGPGSEPTLASAADPALRLCTHLAGHLVPTLLRVRMTLGHGGTSIAALADAVRHGAQVPWSEEELAADLQAPLEWFDALYEKLMDAGHPDALAYHLLLAADLRFRVGDPQTGRALLRQARQYAVGRPATAGFAALLAGDWRLSPLGAAEQCGALAETPDIRPLSLAAQHYARAEAAYASAHSQAGRAAALLRIAHIRRLEGSAAECRDLLGLALEAAVCAGDGGCTALIRVHSALDLIEAGEAKDVEGETAEAVVSWATSVGSASWLRGLHRLVVDRAQFWSGQGYTVESGRASRLASLLSADADGGPGHPAPGPAAVDRHRASHRLAALVQTDLEHQEHLDRVQQCVVRGEPPARADCLGVVESAKVLHDQASLLRDPDLMAASLSSTRAALRIGARLLTDWGTGTSTGTGVDAAPVRIVLGMIESDLASCRPQELLFRSRRARSAGLETEADLLAQEALEQAESIADPLFQRLVRRTAYADLRRMDEARAEATAVEPHMTAIQAASLWLRVGEPERAAPHVRRIGVDGPGPAQPWELPAILADLELARGAHAEAADHALHGLAAFEKHRVRLARDGLRASFADDPVVAGLHHAAVLSLLELGSSAAAFDQAERSRAGFLDAVRALDSAGEDQDTRTAVRTWLAAEVRWSAEYEEQAAALRRAAGPRRTDGRRRTVLAQQRRRRIAEVEQGLDAAESAVRRLAPAALSASYGPELPDADAVAAALPPDAVLLTYHLYDDDLVAWAMTRRTLCAQRHSRWAHSVVASARRFRDWCAGRDGGDGEADGHALAELLLGDFRRELGEHRRVIVVPPAGLAQLPFHALPWCGDVLAAGHEVSYLPAASLLTRLRGLPPERPWTDLQALLVGSPATHPRHSMPDLPGTAAEAVELARLLPRSRLLTGADATLANVLEAAGNCELLHFATHGVIDDLAPHRSRLPLAGDDRLGLADLLVAGRAPQLLTLSACDTGRGAATAGGDVLGLTRAALIAGARHAIVSLWPVRDSTGCLVVARTYRRLAADATASVGTALVSAQREVREMSRAERNEEFRALTAQAGLRPAPDGRDQARSWSQSPSRDSEQLRCEHDDDRHPYHWAPFIHVGV
ncbi:CHAT domain-containing protein [Streptomyces sp. NPDC051907]|uniref:CHAT domain-containing protein n=1 Tax=Streptomyces sp. NPDC051907 TaxID=3155284 RepID=UPI0034158FB0